MRQRAPILILTVAMAASAALLFSYTSHLTFLGDSWELLVRRPRWSLDTFFEPFNEHPVVIPALVYKSLLAVFGMNSALPFHAVAIALFLLCAVLVFVYMRRRVGDWLALCGAALLLFMGAAHEDLLWEFQMCFFGSIAGGVGSLLALDREDRLGDWLASLLLVLATAFSTLGVPFIIAAASKVALGPTPRLRRAFIPLLPLALYAIWWLSSGHSAGNELGLSDLPDLPGYVFDAASAGVASLLGRQPIEPSGHPPALAQFLTVILGLAFIYWFGRKREMPAGLIVALVLAFSFWGLLALDRGPQRFSSRFQYPSGVFLLIVAAEALRGYRLPRPVALAAAAITVAAVAGGVMLLNQGYSTRWKPTSDSIRATLATVDLAGTDARPTYEISLPPSISVSIGRYRRALRAFGTPAYSETQLLASDESVRRHADRVFVSIVGVRLVDEPGHPTRCRRLNPGPDGGPEVQLLRSGVFRMTNLAEEDVTVEGGLFAPYASARVGSLSEEASESVDLPAGVSQRQWQLGFNGGPVRLCSILPTTTSADLFVDAEQR
jgi:hypothetical protein